MGLVGAALGAVGSIYGGISASHAMNDVVNDIKKQQSENQSWFDKTYNEEATQRADAQRLITLTEDSIKRRNKRASGAKAVMGGTNESVAAEQQANADSLASAVSGISAQNDARKDAINQQYMAQKNNLQQQMNQVNTAKANAISQAVQGISSAAGDLDLGDVKMFGKDIPL